MTDACTVKFEGFGPQGTMDAWNSIKKESLAAGSPVPADRGHTYLEVKELGLSAGVWDCTPFTSKEGPYTVNELMHVLEGTITIVEKGGRETTIKAGETFIIPKGLVCAWKQPTYVRKFFVIFDDASGAKAKDPSTLHVIKVDTKAPLGPMEIADTSMFFGPVPTQTVKSWFEDASGQLTVGVWATTPFTRKVAPFGRYELMHILEGEVTISDGKGGDQTFKAGDTFLVPEGAPCAWSNKVPVKKIYTIFKARAAAANVAAAE
ncbi:MAG: DUF861 domain-containing protein [Alphaproteobacteria bacterium]|nr:DUF861 domain-containing protein [Alphaproteobacteria bacterium]